MRRVSFLMRRAATAARLVLGLLMSVPVLLVLTVLRPLCLIRIGTLRSERIGHFSADVEAFLCQRDRPSVQRIFDIVGCPRTTCNRHLRLMWKRTFRFFDFGWLTELLELSFRRIPGAAKHAVKLAG